MNALNLEGIRIAGGEGTRKREAADNTRYGEKATKSAADLKAEFEQCLDRIRQQPASRTKSSGTHKQEAHDDSAPTASETAEPSPQAESTAAAPSSSSAAGQQQQQVIWDQILKNLPKKPKKLANSTETQRKPPPANPAQPAQEKHHPHQMRTRTIGDTQASHDNQSIGKETKKRRAARAVQGKTSRAAAH